MVKRTKNTTARKICRYFGYPRNSPLTKPINLPDRINNGHKLMGPPFLPDDVRMKDATTWLDEHFKKLPVLFEHYKIEGGSYGDRLEQLSLALAYNHEPDFLPWLPPDLPLQKLEILFARYFSWAKPNYKLAEEPWTLLQLSNLVLTLTRKYVPGFTLRYGRGRQSIDVSRYYALLDFAKRKKRELARGGNERVKARHICEELLRDPEFKKRMPDFAELDPKTLENRLSVAKGLMKKILLPK